MDAYGMDPTWGALEDALAPQRQEILRNLLAGKRGIDPGQTPITGQEEERSLVLASTPQTSADPVGTNGSLRPATPEGLPAARRAPQTIYDTPYGEDLRRADREVKNAFWGYQQENTRRDRDRLTRLAEAYLARSEGRDEDAARMSAAERASENALAGRVLDASSDDSAQRTRERIAALSRKRFSRGNTIDRGAAGVFQPIFNEDTGETAIERLDIPALEEKPKPPAVHGLGAGGGVYFDPQGRPRVIAPAREPQPQKPAEPPRIPAGVAEKLIDVMAGSPDFDPADPQALSKMVLMLRQNGLLPNAAAGPGPSADAGGPMPGGGGRGPQVVSGRVGGPARPAGGARTAVNPRTGERLVLSGGKWVPAR